MLTPDRISALLDGVDSLKVHVDEPLPSFVRRVCETLRFSPEETEDAVELLTSEDALPSAKNRAKLDFRAPNRCSVELPGGTYYTREWEKGEKKLYEHRVAKRIAS